MTELSNAVTVLIARMETHPEDFAVDDGEMYSKSKFGEMVHGLYALTEVDPSVKNAFWYLNDADKQALADAWRKYHYKKFEKKVMERVFDEGYYERQDQARVYEQQMKQQMYQQRMAVQSQLAASTGTYQTTQIQPGQFHHHPAQNNNSGLLGSLGSALGLTK